MLNILHVVIAAACFAAPPRTGLLLRGVGRFTPPPHASLPDARFRKSRTLYEQLEEGRECVPPVPASKPVLLAPAGGWGQVEAAIKAGADAVYFGCSAGLNARARATNFDIEELPSSGRMAATQWWRRG